MEQDGAAGTVLLAEDSALGAAVVRDALAPDGHRLEHVGDGRAALRRLGHGPPVDLLITDGEMPEPGGLALCREVRRLPALRLLPVIVLTASEGRLVEALDAGADDHLIRPFVAGELRARVRAALRMGRLRAALRAERDMSDALVESMQDGLLVLARDGEVLRVNERMVEITGWGREALVGARPPYPFWPEARAGDYGDHLRRALRGGDEGEADREYRHADGSRRSVIVSLSRLAGDAGDGPAFVSTVKDATARRVAERALRRSEAVARRLAREQGALARVAEAVAAARPPDEVFALVAEEVAAVMEMESGGVVRFAGDGPAVVVGHWSADPATRVAVGTALPRHVDSIVERARRTGRTASGPAHRAPWPHLAPAGRGPRMAVAAPVVVDGRPWGVVGAIGGPGAALPPGAEERAAKFGVLVGLAISGAEARAELRRLATTDPLTGLLNRRGFEERLRPEVLRARRSAAPLSVVMLDLDHFKDVNDRHGHAAGDRTLQLLAERMRATTRASDVIARVGGEEFAWLLPGTDADGARALAERLRRAVAAAPFGVAGTRTISGGVAELGPRDDGAALLRAADARLYAAKAAGRDRVVAA